MACIKKIFLKDRGSWTPATIDRIPNISADRSRRYTIIDYDNARSKYATNEQETSITSLKFADNKPPHTLSANPKYKTKSTAQHNTQTKHSSKRPAPKPPKKNSRHLVEPPKGANDDEISNHFEIALEKHQTSPKPSTSVVSVALPKGPYKTIQTPTYLDELKEKQNVLRERKKSLPDFNVPDQKHGENYEELSFRAGAACNTDKHNCGNITKNSVKMGQKSYSSKSHKQQNIQETIQGRTSKAKKLDRDSGVHVGENGVGSSSNNDDAEAERTSSVHESDDFKTSTRVKGRRKEGLIFSRPKLSKEQKQIINVYEKDERTQELIRSAIEANEFLNNYMNKECKKLVVDAMEPAVYEKGSFIIRENEDGSEIYVSDEGVFDVIKNNEIINTFGSGNVFGELAILYTAKRFASIRASTKAKVWKIERTKFRTIMVNMGNKEREENIHFLRSVPLLKDLPEEILLKVVELLKRVFFPANTCIVRQGNVGNDFFIIRGGSVTIKKSQDGAEDRIVGRRRRGEYFGEQALLNEDRRMASVYADPPGTECLKLDRVSFISYLGTIPELKEKPVDRLVASEERRASNISNVYSHIQFHELERVATLGVGGFGRVDLVSYKGTQTFALKVLRKIDIIKQEQIDHVYSEKMVMQMCHSPFIVELYTTFRDSKCVYFLMEACLGGDVWTIMHQRQYFDEKTARFIVGCVVEAFEFLHARNIIYRDLKPENLMLTPDGYCKLVDFGFAKRISPNGKTNTFAGTPVYVAPEIILDRGHDRAVDYWELGILIHELLTGRPPFRGRDEMKIYQQILGGIEVKMSTRLPKAAQNLIKNLCKQIPAERLGYQKRGILDIKKHSWFEGFDWNKLQNKTMAAPIKRPIRNNTDLRYFTLNDDTFDTPPDELSGWDKDF